METATIKYLEYVKQMQDIAQMNNACAVLGWDQETYLPPKGADFRGKMLATLSGMSHDMAVEPKLGSLLDDLVKEEKSLDETSRKNLFHSRKDYLQQKKYSRRLVEALSQVSSEAYHAWVQAREKNDFSIYAPVLQKMIDLKHEEAEALGYNAHPYDALLDLYEPELTSAEVELLFESVKSELQGLVKAIASKKQIENRFMFQSFEKDKQWALGIQLLQEIGFDFEAGRQDLSVHPFTTSFNPLDVRLTTHVNEQNLYSMIWSCLHEGGHGLYEQGLNPEQFGLPCGTAISLGVHESQSRFWENCVGRSKLFWSKYFTLVKEHFPAQMAQVNAYDFYMAANIVAPSLIRIEADELTYHFHIIIRFEIEKALMDKSLLVKDLPKAWNQKYFDYLGVTVPDDKQGCLQDIHWCHGSIGYFPTYSIGSFYAAQYFNEVKKQMPDLEKKIAAGDLLPIRNWLKENIHQHGKFYTAKEICEKVTGEKLNVKHFINYAKEKFSEIYSLS